MTCFSKLDLCGYFLFGESWAGLSGALLDQIVDGDGGAALSIASAREETGSMALSGWPQVTMVARLFRLPTGLQIRGCPLDSEYSLPAH